MDFLCEVCDRSLIENPSEYQVCLTTLRKKDDKSLYKKMLLKTLIWMNVVKY